MRHLPILTLLLPLGLAYAAGVPEGGVALPRDAAGEPVPGAWSMIIGADAVLPAQLSIAGRVLVDITVYPEGLLVLDDLGFDPRAPRPLAELEMHTVIAPFWATLEPGPCPGRPAGVVSRIDGPASLTLVWRDVPVVDCPAEARTATFSVELRWDANAVIRALEFRYAQLPAAALSIEPRAGYRLRPAAGGAAVFELLPDSDARPERGRAKQLLDGSSDGERGAWIIEVGDAGEVVGELEPIVAGPDGELEPPDGVREADNCPMRFNPRQENVDGDRRGDACDPDMDADRIPNELDNCPRHRNVGQVDQDGDGVGDVCDSDIDGDMWPNRLDACPSTPDPGNHDLDRDGIGDACDRDADGDDVWAVAFRRFGIDRCPLLFDPLRWDRDHDGLGDACDLLPDVPCIDECQLQADLDGDGINHVNDRCPFVYDPGQQDLDGDGRGDACDPDDDGDGMLDVLQPVPAAAGRFGGGRVPFVPGDMP